MPSQQKPEQQQRRERRPWRLRTSVCTKQPWQLWATIWQRCKICEEEWSMRKQPLSMSESPSLQEGLVIRFKKRLKEKR